MYLFHQNKKRTPKAAPESPEYCQWMLHVYQTPPVAEAVHMTPHVRRQVKPTRAKKVVELQRPVLENMTSSLNAWMQS
jgi:hypothetical protein